MIQVLLSNKFFSLGQKYVGEAMYMSTLKLWCVLQRVIFFLFYKLRIYAILALTSNPFPLGNTSGVLCVETHQHWWGNH